MSMTTIDDLLAGGGAAGKGLKFDTVGTNYTGTVVSAEIRPYTDLQTGKPQTWENGDPKQQIVIGIQTDLRDPSIENDDGVRYDYVKAWGVQKKALQEASRQAGGSPAPGDLYSVTFVREEPSKTRGFNPTKVYEYVIRKANPLDAVVQAPVQAAQPVAQAAPVQPGLDAAQQAQVKQLIALGLTDENIAAALPGVTAQAAAAFRAQATAPAGGGF